MSRLKWDRRKGDTLRVLPPSAPRPEGQARTNRAAPRHAARAWPPLQSRALKFPHRSGTGGVGAEPNKRVWGGGWAFLTPRRERSERACPGGLAQRAASGLRRLAQRAIVAASTRCRVPLETEEAPTMPNRR